MRGLVGVVLFLASGCLSGDPSRLVDQDVADETVWRGLYGRTDAPPITVWLAPDPECGSGLKTPIDCDWGYTQGDAIFLPVPADGSVKWTQIAHEMRHAKLWREAGDDDPLHLRKSDWKAAEEAERALWYALSN